MESDYCAGFCGRVPLNGTAESLVYSECGPCPWGYRNVDNFKCELCTQSLRAYDYSFFIFHAVVPLFINGIFIKIYTRSDERAGCENMTTKWLILQLICAAMESTLGLICAILVFSPVGSLQLYGCRRGRFNEWYSMFQNPVVNYTHTLRCTYEVVYPLYSLPFVIYTFCLLALVMLRTILYAVSYQLGVRLSSAPYYAALWTLPIMGLVHALLGGFIYHMFSNLTIFTALLSNSIHLALEGRRGVVQMIKHIVNNIETLILVFVHLLLFGYGVFATYFNSPPNLTEWTSWLIFAAILPVPVVFYVITVRLTEPVRTRNRR